MTGRSVTLDDVAVEAGVHPATVSRVLSRPELVKEATSHRVRAAIDALGYVPNRAARQLAGGRTSRVGVLVPDISNPWFAQVIREIERTAAATDETLLVAGTAMHQEAELSALRAVAGNVDGIIVCSPVASTARTRAAADGVPLVYVNRRARGVSSVCVDQRAVIRAAVDHFRGLGHERIGVQIGPTAYWSSAQRRRAAAQHGVESFGPIEPSHEGGLLSIDAVLEAGFTAVAAFNDICAFGLIAAATERDLAVPGDLSVVGCDDVSFAAMHRPALTTVDGHAAVVGAGAVELLHAALAGAPPSETTVEPSLVVRSSSGAR